MKDAILILFLMSMVVVTTIFASNKIITFDKLDSFQIETINIKRYNMKTFLTEIIAQDAKTKEWGIWAGPRIVGKDKEAAQRYLDENDMGYCKIVGQLKETVIYPKKEIEKRN